MNKKILSFVFLMFMLSMSIMKVHAENDETTINWEQEMYTDKEDVLADVIRDGMLNRLDTITVGYASKTSDYLKVCKRVMNMVFEESDSPKEGDYLLWNCQEWKVEAQTTVTEKTYFHKLKFDFTYRTTEEFERNIELQIEENLSELYGFHSLTDCQKLENIYDFVRFQQLENSQDYACLFYRLVREIGIDTRIISGSIDGEAHVWNIVKVNNKYYYVDAARDVENEERQFFLAGTNDWNNVKINSKFIDDYILDTVQFNHTVCVDIDGNRGFFTHKRDGEKAQSTGQLVYVSPGNNVKSTGLRITTDPKNIDNSKTEFLGWSPCILQEYMNENGEVVSEYYRVEGSELLTTTEMQEYTIPECAQFSFIAVWKESSSVSKHSTASLQGNGGEFSVCYDGDSSTVDEYNIDAEAGMTYRDMGYSILEDPICVDDPRNVFMGWLPCEVLTLKNAQGKSVKVFSKTFGSIALSTDEMLDYEIPSDKKIVFFAQWELQGTLEGATVEIKDDYIPYSGYATQPQVSVTDKYGKYVPLSGYNIFYKNNVQPGESDVIVCGKGDYSGQATEKFSITISEVMLKITNEEKSGKPQISFKAVDKSDEYTVWRKTGSSGSYKKIATIKDTTYVDTSAEAGIKYYYKVRSIYKADSSGNSKLSSSQYTICDLAQPTINLSNEKASGQIKISWDAIEGATKYKVYRCNTKTGNYEHIKSTKAISYVDDTTYGGQTRYYKVIAIADKSEANSAYSERKSLLCKFERPEVTISNDLDTGKIKLQWQGISSVVDFKIYRSTSKNGTYKLLDTVSPLDRTYIDKTAVAGKKYYYKIMTYYKENTKANSTYSLIKSCTCDLARPKVTLSNVGTSGKIKISWNAVNKATAYKVYRSSSKDGKYTLKKTVTSRTSYTDTSAVAGKKYYYKVVAVYTENTAANSAYSSVKSRTCDLARPSVTISLNKSGKPVVAWKKVSGAAEYKVYYSTSKDGKYSLLKTTTGLSYTHTGAKAGTTYCYKVVAVYKSNTSANSAYSTVAYKKSK